MAWVSEGCVGYVASGRNVSWVIPADNSLIRMVLLLEFPTTTVKRGFLGRGILQQHGLYKAVFLVYRADLL